MTTLKKNNLAVSKMLEIFIDTQTKLKVCSQQNIVYHISSYGPIFGDGSDLIVYNFSNSNWNSHMKLNSYEFTNGKSGTEGGKFIVGGSDNKFQIVEI